MVASQAQRSQLFSTLLVGVATYVLISHTAPSFVGMAPQSAPSMRGSVATGSFKDDFDAWRSSLSKEEKEIVADQASKVFDKKYQKTETSKIKLPQEKTDAFAKVLGKFYDNEDYKKDVNARIPDYSWVGKSDEKEFGLKMAIVQVHRDADRRYDFAQRKIIKAIKNGEYYPMSSPRMDSFKLKVDASQKADVAAAVAELKTFLDSEEGKKWVAANPDRSVDLSKYEKDEIPMVVQHDYLAQLAHVKNGFDALKEEYMKNGTAFTAAQEANFVKAKKMVEKKLVDNWANTMTEVWEGGLRQRDWFRTQRPNPDGKITKAQVVKEIWEVFGEQYKTKLPPLDEELMADLEKEPAGHGFIHPWGTADKLYKSEAVDTFGARFLLGVFETKDEARAAFEEWNKEYQAARESMKEEFATISKQESARMEEDATARDRILSIIDESRTKMNSR